MYSYLTDDLVWALIREREDEVRGIRPHTAGWPATERAMTPPSPLRYWLTLAFRRHLPAAPQYR